MNDYFFPEALMDLIRQRADELLVEFTVLADAVSRAFGIMGCSMQEAEKAFEKLFKQAEKQSIASVGTSPKKYGMSLRKRPYNSVCRYHYIPKTPRNLPYMRRAY